jgi:bacterial/archaeal transporter family-2 protein
MEALAIPFLLLVGSLLALQAAANVQLSAAMASPFGASTLQLGIAAALLLLIAVAGGSLGAFGLLDQAEPWELMGGLGSAIYITSGIVLFPRLGAVVTVGLWIAGQMLASLVLDGFGWLGLEPDPLGVPELVGAAAVLSGTAMIVLAQAEGQALRRVLRERSGWLGLALLAGAALPIQGAVNAELRAELDAPIATGALSFLVATAAMGLLLAVTLSLAGGSGPRLGSLRAVPWWGWLGGLVGATYVTAVFSLMPEIGAAPTIALTVAGQQVASVLVDRFGLFRLPRRRVSVLRLGALTALLAGMGLIQVG